jgi:hypothetical protein
MTDGPPLDHQPQERVPLSIRECWREGLDCVVCLGSLWIMAAILVAAFVYRMVR